MTSADAGGQPNDNAAYGICNAWKHNTNGQENGNVGNAPPFKHLQEQADEADQTVEEYCAEVAHPGGGNGGNGGNGNQHGLCNAWMNNTNGQENGNPENAPPFQGLQDDAAEAGQTVEEYCAGVPHPGDGNGP